jgi:V/A-type H+-transporting ATPase subunit K
MRRKTAVVILAVVLITLVGAVAATAQADGGQTAQAAQAPARVKGDLAIGLIALGTGIAQSRIGAAGAGTIAEKPESIGAVILLIAIPETMVILGFVIAIIMMFIL